LTLISASVLTAARISEFHHSLPSNAIFLNLSFDS
jgi:hypothetical protein